VTSYRESGVDLEAAERHVSAISKAVTDTWTRHVIGGFGGFAAGVELPAGYSEPVLMMSTDGVGTKLEIARQLEIWEGVGYDLVAMCVDDLAAVGAKPLGFVDYLAVGALDQSRDKTIVESISRACIAAGCALLGGETAEHPGVMAADAVDLAGAAMGVIERADQLGPHLVESDDLIIGLESPNLRSNGFSLVRSVLGDQIREHAEALLEPSVIYSPSVVAAVAAGGVHAAAHITGGGLAGNLKRVIPAGLGADIDTSGWSRPAVFSLLEEAGIAEDEMFRTFNMGIGFCLLVDPDAEAETFERAHLHNPRRIGQIVPSDGIRLS
jgi:phosphoribosylformylglycinamidine cyclo-ligase